MKEKKKALAILALIGLVLVGLIISQKGKVRNDSILPSTVTVADIKEEDDDEQKEAQDDTKDYSLYEPMMFAGKWILQDAEGEETIKLPSNTDPDSRLIAQSMPEEIVFEDDIFTSSDSPEYKKTSRYVHSDCYNLRASYHLSKDAGKSKDTTEIAAENTLTDSTLAESTADESKHTHAASMDLAGIFDVRGSRLALGLIGLDPEEKPLPGKKEMDLTEIQYDINWHGDTLILSYKNSKATYKPSRYQKDPLFFTDDYLFLGKPAKPDMDFHAIKLEDDSNGKIFNVYGYDLPMTYHIDKDGSFHVELDQGMKWDYKEYLISDNGLVLRKDNENLIFTSSFHFMDNEYSRSVLQLDTYSPAFEYNGARTESPLGRKISKMMNTGYILHADLDSEVGAGKISEVFSLEYNGIPLKAKACNITNVSLPLKSCYLCWFHCDMENEGLKLLDIFGYFYGSKKERTLSLEDTMEDLQKRYDNLFQVGSNQLSSSSSFSSQIDDYEIETLDCQVIMPAADSQLTVLDFKDNKLTSCTLIIPAYYYHNMHYNTAPEMLCSADAGKAAAIRKTAPVQNKVSSALANAIGEQMGDSLSIQEPDENGYVTGTDWETCNAEIYAPAGTIQIPWTKLFEYGKPDLSKEGQALLDQVFAGLEACMNDPDIRQSISDIDICSYTGLLDQETARKLTQERADSIYQYAVKKYGKEEGSLGLLLKPTGCGVTDYLSVCDQESQMGSFIEIHCHYNPVSASLANQDMEAAVISPEESDDHLYMDPDQESFNEKARDLAERYQGIYKDKSYSVESLDLNWDLPKGWHFASDQELTLLNGGAAPDLLNSGNSIYIMAAYSEDYGSMAHIRIYPGQILTGYSEDEEKNIVQAMHKSLLAELGEYAKDIKDSLEANGKDGKEEYRSKFTYTDGGKKYHRSVSYIIREDLLVLASEIIRE